VLVSWLISGLEERLFAAARADNEDLLLEVFDEDEGNFDINDKDG
jgi:hypothetical protein